MKRQVANLPASVLDRLRNIAQQEGRPFQEILTLYGLERFLYRLSKSEFRDRFVLKGALVMLTWDGGINRSTRDMDFRAFVPADPEEIEKIIREICAVDGDADAVDFDRESIIVEPIIDQGDYPSFRARFQGRIDRTVLPVQLDISLSGVMIPEPEVIFYPTFLGHPKPKLRAYRVETIVAEKVEAMVQLGLVNTRMKDFYDLFTISNRFDLQASILDAAIRATFSDRQTGLDDSPAGLSQSFVEANQDQWRAFLRRIGDPRSGKLDFDEVAERIRAFILPILKSAKGGSARVPGFWDPSSGWSD